MNLFIFIMFLLVLAAICAGIWHEDKLIRFERGVVAGVKQTVKEWSDETPHPSARPSTRCHPPRRRGGQESRVLGRFNREACEHDAV